jgi:predicted acyltransferase
MDEGERDTARCQLEGGAIAGLQQQAELLRQYRSGPLNLMATIFPRIAQDRFSRVLSAFISRDLARRDVSLDAFRGLMILGMILVNHPGPTGAVYPPLMHAVWEGWTLADVIFPGFLFVVGMSIHFSTAGAGGSIRSPRAEAVGKIVRRFALLLLINFVLINFPYYTALLRFNGTLALIAWCYLFAALAQLALGWRALVALAVGALAIQWAVIQYLPLPGVGAGSITRELNAARYLDSVMFAPVFGPSWAVDDGDLVVLHGMGLPVLGSIATTLIGVLAGRWWLSDRPQRERIAALFAVGFGLVAVGEMWGTVLPISKLLWSGSFVFFMAGIAMQTLALMYWITSYGGYRAWTKPLQVAGANALFFYVFAQCLQRVLVYGRVRPDGQGPVRLRQFIYEHFFAGWTSGEAGALAFALVFLIICYAVVLVLYHRRIFVKL